MYKDHLQYAQERKFPCCFIAHRLHSIPRIKITQTPKSGLAPFLGGCLPPPCAICKITQRPLTHCLQFCSVTPKHSEGQKNKGKSQTNPFGDVVHVEGGTVNLARRRHAEGFLWPVPAPRFFSDRDPMQRAKFARANPKPISI